MPGISRVIVCINRSLSNHERAVVLRKCNSAVSKSITIDIYQNFREEDLAPRKIKYAEGHRIFLILRGVVLLMSKYSQIRLLIYMSGCVEKIVWAIKGSRVVRAGMRLPSRIVSTCTEVPEHVVLAESNVRN